MRHGLGLVLLCLFVMPVHGFEDPVTAGRDWLLTQARDDGAFHNTTTQATPAQASAEVLAISGISGAAAREFLQQHPFQGTEYLARRLLRGAGNATALLARLRTRQNLDGGFGDLPGYQSTVTDTAHALKALAANGQAAPAAVGFLLAAQSGDGGWAEGANTPSVFTTALALEGLYGYREEVAVAAAMTRAETFLRAGLADPGKTHLLALTLRALLPLQSEIGLETALRSLRNLQGEAGDWHGDVYTTALAVQVLTLAGQTPVNPDLGMVRGRLVSATSGWPLAGLGMVLEGPVVREVTSDTEGAFGLGALVPGDYRLTVQGAPDYQTLDLEFTVSAGEVLELGPLALSRSVTATGIAVFGTVRDNTGAPLAGVALSLGQEQAISGEDGRYRIQDLVPGDWEIRAALAGYQPLSAPLVLVAGAQVVFSPVLLAEDEIPPDGAVRLLGRVVDAGSGHGLAGVTLGIDGMSLGVSDADGYFEVDSLPDITPDSTLALNFAAPGYHDRRLAVVAVPEQRLDLGEIRLRPELPLLADLQVLAVDTEAVRTDPLTLALSGTLQATVANHGAVASGEFRVGVFADTDGDDRQGEDEPTLGSTRVPSLAPDGQTTLAMNLSGTGAYRDVPLAVLADSRGQVPESHENNNLASSLGHCRQDVGPPTTLEPVLKWQWQGDSVTTTPMVAPIQDTDGDGRVSGADVPAVLVISHRGFPDGRRGTLHALDGPSGAIRWSLDSHAVNAPSQLALGDLDGDGFPEIIASRYPQGTLAISGDGEVLWESRYPDYVVVLNYGGYSLADLDGDGRGEITHTRLALNADGSLRWLGQGNAHGLGLNAVADLDRDGRPEVVVGPSLYGADGELLWERTDLPDGKVAVAELHGDSDLEIVLAGNVPYGVGYLHLLDREGNLLWGPVRVSPRSVGAPTIGDVDGDGVAEIGVGGQDAYTLVNADGSVRWAVTTLDSSSQAVATFFDLDGDGIQEVIYGDSNALWILAGDTGVVRYRLDNPSYTAFESPTVADVDNDGHAELVVVSSDGRHSVRVLENLSDDWSATRPIRNQHAYHPGAVGDGGELPRLAGQGWASFNGFRNNPLLSGAVTADPSLGRLQLIEQPGELPDLQVRVGNAGAAEAGPLTVTFHQRRNNELVFLGEQSLVLAGPGYRDVVLPAVSLRGQGALVAALQFPAGATDCRTANNRVEAPVAAPVLGRLSLVGAQSLAPGESLALDVRADNPGTLVADYRLDWWVEDVGGVRVTVLPPRSLGILQGGAYREIRYDWSPGDLLAGEYRIVARLLDGDGAELDRQSLAVELEADSRPATVQVLTGRADYRIGDSVGIQILLHNPSLNRLLEAGRVSISMHDPRERLLLETERAVPALVPGQYQRLDLDVALTPGLVSGDYRITVTFLDAGPTVSASAGFRLDEAPSIGPLGQVQVVHTTLAAGEPQRCRYTVQAPQTHTFRTGLLALGTATALAWETHTGDGTDNELVWERSLDTATLEPGDWACVLEIAEGETWRGLAYGVFGLTARVDDPPVDDPPVDDPPVDDPPVDDPPVDDPPVDDPPVDDPPVDDPDPGLQPVPIPTLHGSPLLVLVALLGLIASTRLVRRRCVR